MRHPVDDFLFDYYAYSPGHLASWHPGFGVILEGADEYAEKPHYVRVEQGVTLDERVIAKKQLYVQPALAIMLATKDRPAMTGCFALHEWAMVHGLTNEEVRHDAWPLRLTPAAIEATIDDIGLRCTHFDAFRFYTDSAVPKNQNALTRANQIQFEQPGCLHATMDLYRWAFTLSPLIESELVADAFELARRTRTLDMRASPYDLEDLGLAALPVETEHGRSEYAKEQQRIIDDGQRLRATLIERITQLYTST